MTPFQERLRAKDYEVRDIPLAEARAFIIQHHYSKGCSNTRVYSHGLFRRGESELLGAAIWLPPTRRAAESVNAAAWRRVLALTRLAVRPGVPKNAATFLIGRSVKMIRADARFDSLVTYADEFMGHTGGIYRASNWIYCGFMKGCPRWEDSNGRQVSRLATKSRTYSQMSDLGYKMVGVFGKHKFVMHLNDNLPAAGNDNHQ